MTNKILLTILPFLLTITEVYGQHFRHNKQLKGRIKQMDETIYYASEYFGEPIKDSINNRIIKTFDERGNMIKSKQLLKNELWETTEFIFDTSNNLIKLISKGFVQLHEHIRKPNEKIETIYENGEFSGKSIEKFDNAGKQIELRMYAGKGGILKAGELYKVVNYEYDISGNLVKKSFHYPSGKISDEEVFKYDSKNKLFEKSVTDFRRVGGYEKQTYLYDIRGNVIEEIYHDKYSDDSYSTIYRIINKYNENDLVIESTTVIRRNIEVANKVENTVFYKYEYDEMGNWTKMLEYSGFELGLLTERSFQYYAN
jgi:hypothetical protein